MIGPEFNITHPSIYRTSTANPFVLAGLVYESIPHWVRRYARIRPDYSFPSSMISDFKKISLSNSELYTVLLLATFFTMLRYYLQVRLESWTQQHNIYPRFAHKVPESFWKLTYYGTVWIFAFYFHMCVESHDIFKDPLSMWVEWESGHKPKMHWQVQVIYAVQSAFYIHSIYATLFMDLWRKDSWLMFVHHFVALGLLFLSYVDNFTLPGVLVLFLHDNSDATLEITKLSFYLKKRTNGQYYKYYFLMGNAAFILFAIIWVIFRLYWYTCKLLYATIYGAVYLGPQDAPFFPLLGAMLLIIFAMNVYWFNFIARMIWRVALTGEDPEDNREWDTTAVSGLNQQKLDELATEKCHLKPKNA
ncbi:hypothetical protein GCK72_001793 [Caenorhabditis remanei]|uniref:CRE-LAGR-1 protein n=1 Tax=Caenorhabditis remanei TaxID=31234 RepID=E3LLP3_CAERE|nr:hypothetical protein GCK72_001793 [Caenorhabditis remanei]EFP03229.1 CRE-LAGR-1 protein [Caenorhabditis remanei]KAF1769976.1 hypothetical protein GCK72_001793 [Caenorhabditis remanei]